MASVRPLVVVYCVLGMLSAVHGFLLFDDSPLATALPLSEKLAGIRFSSNPSIKRHYFVQNLDHFNKSDDRTFNQKYFSSDELYRRSGPVFLHTGSTGPVFEYQITLEYGGNWMANAYLFGAFCFLIEHRYYGESKATRDVSTANLKWLTTQQSLADMALFIEEMNKRHRFRHPNWIVFGCSYGGALAAWMRLKYPTLVHGAVASSPLLFAKVNLFEYLGIVRDDLQETSVECLLKIAKATALIEGRIHRNENVSELWTLFRTCSQCSFENPLDISTFFFQLYSCIGIVAKNDRNNVGVYDTLLTLKRICAEMLRQDQDVVHLYSYVIRYILQQTQASCLICSYDSFLKPFRDYTLPDALSRLAYYQYASEFGYCQSSDTPSGCPFTRHFPVSFMLGVYKAAYGNEFCKGHVYAGANHTNAYYGGRHLQATNVVIVNGDRDPWSCVSILTDPPPGVIVINIKGGGHCSDCFPGRRKEFPPLIQARQRISAAIRNWLNF